MHLKSFTTYRVTLYLRSSNQYFLHQPRVSAEFANMSFSYLTLNIWNNIPLDIRLSIPSRCTFKRRLKTYLFKQLSYFTPAILFT